jgi:hypothetical protein
MLSLGALSFAAPWLLLALAVLPVLWWLLKLTPPAPRRVLFPAIRLLFGLQPREETPDRTPWWLILLRLVLATLMIVALAHPLLNAARQPLGNGALALIVDDGWAAGPQWAKRQTVIGQLLDEADRARAPVIVLTTAPHADGSPIAASQPMTPEEARRQLQALPPQPWPTDRAAALEALKAMKAQPTGTAVWVADGLLAREDDPVPAIADELLAKFGSLSVYRDAADLLPVLQLPPTGTATALTLRLARPHGGPARTVTVRALADNGSLISTEDVTFAAGATRAEKDMALPAELRNRIDSLAVQQEETAGGVALLDERWRTRPVGLVSGGQEDKSQPLLDDLYYLDRALTPGSEVRRGDVLTLLKRELAVLMLSDVGALTEQEQAAITPWIEKGGVLVRFAGPRLAQNADTLLPVRLRGDRTLGGAMSWEQPAHLAPFPDTSPFAGVKIPPDVVVKRQVLAEPAVDLGDKTWARLEDGTPLVTAERNGSGWLVLVHTTANNDWSNLAISGLFVDMLRRLVGLSEGVVGPGTTTVLPPFQLLDGFGRLAPPPSSAVPASPEVLEKSLVGPRNPPGYYGSDTARRALNLGPAVGYLAPMGPLPAEIAERGFEAPAEVDLKPWLLTAGLVLLLADMLIALALRGLLVPARLRARRPRVARSGTAALLLLALCGAAGAAQAAQSAVDSADKFAMDAALETHLAYVRTHVAAVDATSKAGLEGLTLVLNQRTAVEPAPPMGVDVETDELAFFPLLYWPVTEEQAPPSDAALMRLNAYLRNGGTILFDTRDHTPGGTGLGTTLGNERLRRLVRGLDIPPLEPVPPDHVLTKSFYLMQEFPGRWSGGTVWVERGDDRYNDGVSSVVIGSNDWAAAWAIDDSGQPMFPVVPGGERQREWAYRFGVNLVMYALTGNYKSDQVHVPAILERLGQ